MKKLLILAYDFPPYVSVGGMRPYNWYMYLKEYGVEPIVVTRQWENKYGNHLDYIAPSLSNKTLIEHTSHGTLIRAPHHPNLANRIMLKYGDTRYKLFRKVITALYEFGQFLFPIGPKQSLYLAAKEYLKENKVDAIIATGDPFILFKYASSLSKEFDIPWIADYRDTWVQDKTRSRTYFNQKWNKHFEKKLLKDVHSISTVSEFIKKHLEQNLKGKKFNILLNGYNPDAIEPTKSIEQSSERFIISFAGTIYKWHPIESFLNAFSDFIQENKLTTLQLDFYGINDPENLSKLITTKFEVISKYIAIYLKTENEELVKTLAKSNAFLLFNDYSILGTKIFTYIGIQRKIIFCYTDDVRAIKLKTKYYNLNEFSENPLQPQIEVIKNTNSGIFVKDEDHLKLVLKDLFDEFKQNGKINCDSKDIEQYSRKIQVKKLAEIIKEIHL